MNVFIPIPTEESIGGVYASLEEARIEWPDCSVDEYIVGHSTRLRGYDENGKVWWENGRDIRWDKPKFVTSDSHQPTKNDVNKGKN